MRNKGRIGITIALAVVVLLTGWHVGARWYVLRKVYRNPESTHRVTVVPAELDLADVQVTQGVTCNVGYASFVIPDTSTLDLKSSGGIGILGESDSLSFGLLPPWNPKADEAFAALKSSFDKLPKGHPMRQAVIEGTGLDWMIQMERAHPIPFSRALSIGSEAFKLYTCQLLLKSVIPYGAGGVYTFSTPTTRGLICIGRERTDLRYATVSIEDRAQTQAVGMIARVPDGKDGEIMSILPAILKTFCFSVQGVSSTNRIAQLIVEAGIPPRLQDEEMN